jgi:hypothetical protein
VVNNKIEMSNKQEVVMPSDGWMPIDNEEDDGDNSNGGFTMTDLERLDALEAENAKLKAENAKTSNLLFDTLADNIVGKYKAEGKITPASEKFAKAILMGGIDSTITFEEKETNINTLFANFLDSLPTAVEFSEKLAVEEVTETEFDLNSKIFKGLGITKERLEKFVKEDK